MNIALSVMEDLWGHNNILYAANLPMDVITVIRLNLIALALFQGSIPAQDNV
jgi:hypothetical protein